MRASFIVTYADGSTVEHFVKPRHWLRQEREGRMALDEAKSMENSYYLAWLAATNGDELFDDWMDGVDEIEPAGDLKAPAPPAEGVEDVPPTTGESQP